MIISLKQLEDVQSMLESVDSLGELQQAFNDSESFLKKRLAGAGDQVAKKMLLIKAKSVVEFIASLKQLAEAMSNLEALFMKL